MAQKKFELSLVKGYVHHWGVQEAIRELIQNALDSNSPFIYQFIDDIHLVGHESTTTLALWSEFTTLLPSTLLLGSTTKKDDNNSIGSFGEGYKIAMLVLTRLGFIVEILNGPVRWVPGFEFNSNYQDEILCVFEEPMKDKTNRGLTFLVHGLSADDVEGVKNSCLQMQDNIGAIKRTSKGDILMERPGKLYVGGLYVCDISTKYGYNVKPEFIKLERDRKTVDGWDLKEVTASMWYDTQEYQQIAGMVEEGIEDMDYVQITCPELVREACYELFREKHPHAVVAKNSDELKNLVKQGMTDVIVLNNASYRSAVIGSFSYERDMKKTAKRVAPCHEILTKWLSDNRKSMHTPAIVSFKSLINQSVEWKR